DHHFQVTVCTNLLRQNSIEQRRRREDVSPTLLIPIRVRDQRKIASKPLYVQVLRGITIHVLCETENGRGPVALLIRYARARGLNLPSIELRQHLPPIPQQLVSIISHS